MSNNQGTSSEIINLYRDVNADIQGPFHEAVMFPPPLVKSSLIDPILERHSMYSLCP